VTINNSQNSAFLFRLLLLLLLLLWRNSPTRTSTASF
jgi:hypothetical protein